MTSMSLGPIGGCSGLVRARGSLDQEKSLVKLKSSFEVVDQGMEPRGRCAICCT